MVRTASRSAALFAAFAALASCKREADVTAPLSDKPPAVRSAASFVHCVEAGTSGCVDAGGFYGGWDAFAMLAWLAGGSPTSILGVLNRELARHADPMQVQERFVAQVDRYAQSIRGAECDPAGSQAFAGLIDKAAQQASARLEGLGLLRSGMDQVIAGLAQEAHEQLDGGELVQLDCRREPFRLYVGSALEDGRHRVVGMLTMLPSSLGGQGLDRAMVEQRLRSRALGLQTAQGTILEGAVNSWMRFPLEDL